MFCSLRPHHNAAKLRAEFPERPTIMPDLVSTMLNWAADEGWNPGLDDAAPFLAADPDGFFSHAISDNPVAAISVVNHSDSFAFLGLYLCQPGHRGLGFGLRLWNHAIKHAGSRTIGLDGVPDQQANYRKSGFRAAGKTVRWQGFLPDQTGAAARPVTPQDMREIAAWDFQQVGFARPEFLNAWLTDCATRRTLVIGQGDRISAYGTIRACREGFKIGPFAAENTADATTLLNGLTGLFPHSQPQVAIDVPASAPALSDLLAAQGFTPGFETARMYKGVPPVEALARFAAVATLELG
jgi:GNAT superfamily N-acetyltransferase